MQNKVNLTEQNWGKYFSEIVATSEWEMFEFVLKGKEYSNDCARGTVCAQSLKKDTLAVRDTKIELIISLGPKEFEIANVKGHTEQEAILELLKQGFLRENIIPKDKYDADSEPGVVLKQVPEYGETVNAEAKVEIYINSYKGEENSSTSSKPNR